MTHYHRYSDVNIVRCERIYDTFIVNFQNQLKHVKNLRGKTFLSVGCGMGHELEAAQKLGMKVTGLDLDKSLPEKLKQYNIIIYNGKRMPFKDNSFDVVSLNMVLEHLNPDEAQSLCKEVNRILKKGGHFIIITPHPRQQTAYFSNFWADQTHIRPYHRAAIENLLRGTNFNIYKSYDFVSTVPIVRKVLTTLKLHPLYYASIPVFNAARIGTLDECVIGEKK